MAHLYIMYLLRDFDAITKCLICPWDFVKWAAKSGRPHNTMAYEIWTLLCCSVFTCGFIHPYTHMFHGCITGTRRIDHCPSAMAKYWQISVKWNATNQYHPQQDVYHVMLIMCGLYIDDVIKWKRFPRYWPFVRGIHRSPVNSPHKGHWRGTLMFSLICVWTKPVQTILAPVIWDAIAPIITSP